MNKTSGKNIGKLGMKIEATIGTPLMPARCHRCGAWKEKTKKLRLPCMVFGKTYASHKFKTPKQ